MKMKEITSNEMEIDSIEIHNGKIYFLITINAKQLQELEITSRELEIPFSSSYDKSCAKMEFDSCELVFYIY